MSNNNHKGWYNRGYLPHYDTGGVYQMITYRLADSLPKERLRQIDAELELTLSELMDDKRRLMIEQWLDAGHGNCILRKKEYAQIVGNTWKYFDGGRYDLISWVVMPNHVHVLIKVYPGHQMRKTVLSWKSFSARKINELSNENELSGRFWQRGYWDRFARNDRHLLKMIGYIAENYEAGGILYGNKYDSI